MIDRTKTVADSAIGQEIYRKIYQNIQQVMKGQYTAIRNILAAFASGGHILLED